MIPAIPKNRLKETLPLILLTVCLILIHYRIQLVPGSDDDFMSSAINTGNLTQLYANNRVVINFFGAFIMSFPLILWKVLNIAVIVFLIAGISYYAAILTPGSSQKDNLILNFSICLLFFLLPFNVLSSGVFWATGSFNYLWGICGSLYISMVFMKDMAGLPVKKTELLTGFILGVYVCDVEQPMVVVCFAGITYLAFCFLNRKKITKGMLFYGIGLILECMPIVLLPFNTYRSIGEQSVYFPDFEMLSFFDKIYQGAMHYYKHLVNELAFLFLLISLFTAILVFKRIQSKLFRGISMLPPLYFFFALIPILAVKSKNPLGTLKKGQFIYDFSERLYRFNMEETSLLAFLTATFIFILLFLLLIYVLQETFQKYAVGFLYVSGFADGMMMSFAPSIFVSGNRVFFAPDVLFLTITAILGKMAVTDPISVSKTAEKIYSCIACFIMLFFAFAVGALQSRGIFY